MDSVFKLFGLLMLYVVNVICHVYYQTETTVDTAHFILELKQEHTEVSTTLQVANTILRKSLAISKLLPLNKTTC